MCIPPAHVGERSLDAQVRFQQLRDLLHAVAELAAGVVDAHSGVYCAGFAARSIFTASKVSSPAA